MELALNIFWFLLALASAAVWSARWARALRSRGHRTEMLRGAVGLACALVLLFFAISLTDDLNAVPAVAEDSRSARRTLQVSKGSQTDPDPDKHVAAYGDPVLLALFTAASMVFSGLFTADGSSPRAAANQPLQGRAPPCA